MELVETVYSEPYAVYSELYTCHIIRASFFADEIEVESLSNKTRSLKTEKRKKTKATILFGIRDMFHRQKDSEAATGGVLCKKVFL